MALHRLLEIALGNATSALGLAVAVAVASRWVRRPAVLHVLWLVVLARLLVPPVFEVALLPGSQAVQPPARVAAGPAVAGEATVPAHDLGATAAVDARGIALLGWLVGAVALLVLAAVRTIRLVGCVRSGKRADPALRQRVERLARRMGVEPPEPRLVAGQLPPMVWGIPTRPVLILPTALASSLGSEELDAVISHELAHLRRRDHWVRYLELAAVVVFWWNPASWWASNGVRAAEEECCDALVARSCPGSSGAYARGLVKTMGFLAGADTFFPAVVTGASHFHRIERRIRMIMTGGFARTVSAPLWAALSVVALSVLLIAPTMAARTEPSAMAADAGVSALTEEPITLTLDQAVLEDVLKNLASVAGLNLLVDSRVTIGSLNARVSCDYHATPLATVLDDVVGQAGLAWTLDGNVLWIHSPGQAPLTREGIAGRPITLDLHGADLRQVLATMEQITGIHFEVDPDVQGTVTVSFVDLPWDQALDLILKANGCAWTSENGGIRVFRDLAQGRIPAAVALPQSPPRPSTDVDGMQVYRFVKGGEITEPVRQHAPQPEYTPEARAARIQGAVVLETVIDTDGRVGSVKVVRGLPLGLTEAAVAAVREWRFAPATLGGEPVAVEYVLAVRFRLDGEAP